MKKLAVIFVCLFVLLSTGANAADRDYYKLKKNALVFVSVLDINKFLELAISEDKVAKEYLNELVNQKLAMQPCEELIVYKFDKFHSSRGVTFYRVKLHKGTTVNFINTNKSTIREVKFQDDTILGWVYDISLKKIKQKK